MAKTALFLAFAVQSIAYPFVARTPGVDASLLHQEKRQVYTYKTCPYNPDHQGAVPYNPSFPYCGAQGDTVPATFPCENNQVPAPGDTAHRYIAPGPLDVRGPCPGLNTAANHGFLSRDGLTTYSELVEMQQNLYGVGYGLANLLATAGVVLDGDSITQKLSIGCDKTNLTSPAGAVMKTGEWGLNGHQKFEADASLTRNDYFLANGDDFRFNRTLYDDMIANYCNPQGACNLKAMQEYRNARWNTSKHENGNFFFGPGSLLLYGAASFLYELFPSGGSEGTADKATMDAFFIDEKLPSGWVSRREAYNLQRVGEQIGAMYQAYPLPFGANSGVPNSYTGFGLSGPVSPENMGTPQGILCALYILATGVTPGSLTQMPAIPSTGQVFALTKLQPIFKPIFAEYAAQDVNFGCPLGPHGPDNPT